MTSFNQTPPQRVTILHSPALHLGSIEVRESAQCGKRNLLSGTRVKSLVFPTLYWLVRHTPVFLAMLPVRLILALLRVFYRWPGNRLRRACETVACVAGRHQMNAATSKLIYNRFLDNALGVIENFFALYQLGRTAVLPRIIMDSDDIETIERLIEIHGGAVLAVPHNIGSALCALRIGHSFDMLLVAKNSPTVARTRIALDFYERMKVSVLMIRGGNTVALSRVLFSVLRQGKLLAATLDNVDRTRGCIPVQMFGQEVGLAGWAAKIATRMQVPIVPAWFQSSGRNLRVITGKPIISDDIRLAVQHYARFFEQRIVEDPSSWAYLADKHWQRILRRAAGQDEAA